MVGDHLFVQCSSKSGYFSVCTLHDFLYFAPSYDSSMSASPTSSTSCNTFSSSSPSTCLSFKPDDHSLSS